MDQQWGSFDNRQARYAPNTVPSQPNSQRDMNNLGHVMRQDGYPPSTLANKTPTMPMTSPNTEHRRPHFGGDGDGDIAMEDADPYRPKHPTRPAHSRQHSQQQIVSEESSAARRYSPMNLSPASPYNATPANSMSSVYGSYSPNTQSRNSPTRQNAYMSPSQAQTFYSPPSASPPVVDISDEWHAVKRPRLADTLPASRPNAPQLPPLQSTLTSANYHPQSAPLHLSSYGREPNSPRHSHARPAQAAGKGPVPKFEKCLNVADLRPRINEQPPFRRANPEGGFISPLRALTTELPATYRICNPGFKYESSRNPRRVLTKPSKGVKNDGYDNEDSDYILYVNDILGSEESGHKNRYLILDVLGQGTFGQVVKCQNLKTQEVVAVKVVKNRTAYFNQSMMEVSVLDLLNKQMDKNDDHHLLRLKDTFIHRQHLCLVFELLSVNLYELIKQNQFRGLSTTLVRVFAQQLLTGLSLLHKARLIHCDLKPENILLKKWVAFLLQWQHNSDVLPSLESPIIKIIDFGSACDERQTVYTYIQSRFYRSPEVLLGLP